MKYIMTGALLCLSLGGAVAAAEPTEKNAIAMAERAAAFGKAHGRDELIKTITEKDPDFVQDSRYIDMRDAKTAYVLRSGDMVLVAGIYKQ